MTYLSSKYYIVIKRDNKIAWLTNEFARTVELQCLEHFWDYENMFEIGVVWASEC